MIAFLPDLYLGILHLSMIDIQLSELRECHGMERWTNLSEHAENTICLIHHPSTEEVFAGFGIQESVLAI